MIGQTHIGTELLLTALDMDTQYKDKKNSKHVLTHNKSLLLLCSCLPTQ